MDDRFYFRQLLSGRDLATSDPLAWSREAEPFLASRLGF